MAPTATALVLALWLAGAPTTSGETWIEARELGGLEARSAALLLTGQPSSSRQLSLYGASLPPLESASDRDHENVLVVIDVAASWLLEHAPEEDELLELYAFAVGPEGDLLGTLTKAIELTPATRAQLAGKVGMKIFAGFDLLPGRSTLRVMLQRRSTDQRVLGVLPIEVAAWTSGAPATVLSAPLLLEGADAWQLVRTDDELDLSRFVPGSHLVPATLPVWGRDPPAGTLLATELPAGVELRLVDSSGRVAVQQRLDPRAATPGPAGLSRWALALPDDRPGDGVYRLVLADVENAALATGPALIVLPDEAPEDVLYWPQLDDLAGRPAATAGLPETDPGEATWQASAASRREQIFDTYRDVLDKLRVDDSNGAATAVLGLASNELAFRTDPANRRRVVEPLEEIAADAVGRMAGDGEQIVPVLWIQAEAYRRAYDGDRHALAGIARRTMIALGDRYLEVQRGKDARRLVAIAYASLAGYLEERGNLLEAERIFQRAVELSPDDPLLRASLASLLEASGRRQEAVDLLEKVVRQSPGDREARLRLAVGLRHLGETRRARRLLEQCTEGDPPGWLGALAAQELAATVATDDPEDAAEILRRARQRYPDHPRLSIQLASVLDALGRPGEARHIVQQLDETANLESSPRLRYTRPRQGAAAKWRSELEEAARRRLATASQRGSGADGAGAAKP